MREDVPGLTKQLLLCALSGNSGLGPLPYEGNPKYGKGYLYGVKPNVSLGAQNDGQKI